MVAGLKLLTRSNIECDLTCDKIQDGPFLIRPITWYAPVDTQYARGLTALGIGDSHSQNAANSTWSLVVWKAPNCSCTWVMATASPPCKTLPGIPSPAGKGRVRYQIDETQRHAARDPRRSAKVRQPLLIPMHHAAFPADSKRPIQEIKRRSANGGSVFGKGLMNPTWAPAQ